MWLFQPNKMKAEMGNNCSLHMESLNQKASGGRETKLYIDKYIQNGN